MTEAEQVHNVQNLGYSEREAKFLRVVALHSGYFIRRQYTPQRGQLADTLCKRVLHHGHAVLSKFTGKTELYHLKGKVVYIALGEEDNKHRRPHDAYWLRGKLMGLDYVLDHPELEFFPTEEAKIQYFCSRLGLDRSVLPARAFQGKDGTTTARYFIEKYPVYHDPASGKTGLLYLDDGLFTKSAFGAWLERHKPLIEALDSKIEVVYAAANERSGFPGAEKEFARVISSLPVEMLRYFDMQRDVELHGLAKRDMAWIDLFRSLRAKYAASNGQYAAWRKGHPAQRETSAALKTEVLPYSYLMLPKLKETTAGTPTMGVLDAV